MGEFWWSLLGAAIPLVVAGQVFRVKKRNAEKQRLKSTRGIACARTVCVNQHQLPNWNDICLRRCLSECLKLSSQSS